MGKGIITVGAVIKRGDEVLLVKHGTEASHLTGVYGIPAGRPEGNERLLDACIREVREETGLVLEKDSLKRLKNTYFAEIERKDGKGVYMLIAYVANAFSGELTKTEEAESIWIKIDRINELNLLPNVAEIIEEAFSWK